MAVSLLSGPGVLFIDSPTGPPGGVVASVEGLSMNCSRAGYNV